MGYKIIYGSKKIPKRNFWELQTLICVFMLVLALCVRLTWPEGTQLIRQILITDTLSQDAEAFMEMLRQVGAGESLSDAVAVFCQEIFHGQ